MSNNGEVDLTITGGTVVTPSGQRRVGIAIDGGRIVAIAADEHLPPARANHDATGLHVLPGLVDSEAHPGCYVPLADDLATESRAAVTAGVTTWGVHAPSTRMGDPDFAEFVQPEDVGSFHDVIDHFTGLVESDSAVEHLPHLHAGDRPAGEGDPRVRARPRGHLLQALPPVDEPGGRAALARSSRRASVTGSTTAPAT